MKSLKHFYQDVMNRLFDLFEETFCVLWKMLLLIFIAIGGLLFVVIKGNNIIKIITIMLSLPVSFFLYSYINKDNRISSSNKQNEDTNLIQKNKKIIIEINCNNTTCGNCNYRNYKSDVDHV